MSIPYTCFTCHKTIQDPKTPEKQLHIIISVSADKIKELLSKKTRPTRHPAIPKKLPKGMSNRYFINGL